MTTRLEIHASLSCLLCGWVAATFTGPRMDKMVATVLNPEHTATVRQLRCPRCGGRLMLGEVSEVSVYERRPLTAEELRPRRGRRPKAMLEAMPIEERPPRCAVCGIRQAGQKSPRCKRCRIPRVGKPLTTRFLDLLACSNGLPTRDAAAVLGCDRGSIRHLVQRARRRGVPIVTDGKRGYRLREAS